MFYQLRTCTEFRLRGNRAKSRFNYRVAVGVVTEGSRTTSWKQATRSVS
ncbi:hypothetical protein [Nostoc sp.]